jgi:deoxyribodipyrimidine photo-lyase
VSSGLVLFTGDLRVHDNDALATAVSQHQLIIPAFVLDETLLNGSCGAPNRVSFLLDSLRDLDQSLRSRGARLVLRRGDPVRQAIRLARRWNAQTIHIARETTPYARARQELLRAACAEERIELRTFPGPAVVEPGRLTPAGGDHYRVFTPYWRAWSSQDAGRPTGAPRRIPAPSELPSMRLAPLTSLVSGSPSPELLPGGETEAMRRLDRWLGGPLGGYTQDHDDLAADRTSKLSPYLHFGCISSRTVLDRARSHSSSEDFIRQLCWRDFHKQVLAATPDLPRRDYRPRGDRWRRHRHDGDAWQAGLTGYPIVDAGMRQLAREGFMHNRARLIVGSFLTKLLYMDWRFGAAHFAGLLLDADVANNVGNWQWVAGTGNDTRPNRVLNPMRQAKRFDPSGRYIRRYVPELDSLEGSQAHAPWLLSPSRRRGLNYPPPILDHETAARELRARRELLHSPR